MIFAFSHVYTCSHFVESNCKIGLFFVLIIDKEDYIISRFRFVFDIIIYQDILFIITDEKRYKVSMRV